jgi:hypothetical protein
VRSVAGVIAGLLIVIAFVQIGELGVHRIAPPPATEDMTAIKAYVASLPLKAYLIVLGGWLVGTFVGTFIAAAIARKRVPVYVLGAILAIGTIATMFFIPQPMWFTLAQLAIFGVATVVAVRQFTAPGTA